MNITFFDGHAEAVKLGDLWALQWSGAWPRGTPPNSISVKNISSATN